MVVALPEGEYRLRVQGTGRLGRIFRFAVVRGQTQRFSVSIDEGRLLGGEESRRSQGEGGDANCAELTAVLELTPGKADLIEWTGEKRSSAATARAATCGGMRRVRSNLRKAHSTQSDGFAQIPAGEGGVRLVEPAPDLNSDGTGDLCVVFRTRRGIACHLGQGWVDALAVPRGRTTGLVEVRCTMPEGTARQ